MRKSWLILTIVCCLVSAGTNQQVVLAQLDNIVASQIVTGDSTGLQQAQQFAAPFNGVGAFAATDAGRSFCLGSLISSNTVLTASHCAILAGDSFRIGVDSNNADFTASVSSVLEPAGPTNAFDLNSLLRGGDVALVTLDRDVPDNLASPFRLTNLTDQLVGREATLIGYGLNGIGSEGHQGTNDGIRTGGTNIIEKFGEAINAGIPVSTNIFSADFDDGSLAANTIPGSDLLPTNFEATSAVGDSGGPLLVEIDGEVSNRGSSLWRHHVR